MVASRKYTKIGLFEMSLSYKRRRPEDKTRAYDCIPQDETRICIAQVVKYALNTY